MRLREKMQLKNIPLGEILEEEAPIDEELVESVRETEQYDPIKVTLNGDGKYRIIGGKRRYLAAKELGESTITALIINIEDQEEFVIRTLVDNSGQPNPMDEAQHMQELVEILRQKGYTQVGEINKRIAQVCRYAPHRVERTLKLLNLIPELQELVKRGKKKREDGSPVGISFSSGFKLCQMPEDEQREVYQEWLDGTKITEPYAAQKYREWQGKEVGSIFDGDEEKEIKAGLFIPFETLEQALGGTIVEVDYQGQKLTIQILQHGLEGDE